MSKNVLGKYYQENKEKITKRARERYQNFSEDEKEKKSNNMVEKVTKTTQKMKNKSLRKTITLIMTLKVLLTKKKKITSEKNYKKN